MTKFLITVGDWLQFQNEHNPVCSEKYTANFQWENQ